MSELIRFDGRTEIVGVLDEERLLSQPIAFVAGAHPDDDTLANGGDIYLTDAGMAVVYLNFTFGDRRVLRNVSKEELRIRRPLEQRNAVRRKRGVMDIIYDYPDGELSSFENDAISSAEVLVDELKPTLILVPNQHDPHPDHASVNRIMKRAANGLIQVYGYDTPTGKDKYGNHVIFDFYLQVSDAVKALRDETYFGHKTQTTDLPRNEKKDVQRVVRRPRQIGAAIGRKYAAGFTVEDPSLPNVFPDIVGRERVILRRR